MFFGLLIITCFLPNIFSPGDVVNRNVICTCLPGFTGDPFDRCVVEEEPPTPCYPDPCGANAQCQERGTAGTCSCLPGYPEGDPYVACRPECVTNSDCVGRGRGRKRMACIQNKCQDPCGQRVCGINAVCNVINQSPICDCFEGYLGDPSDECHPPPSEKSLT